MADVKHLGVVSWPRGTSWAHTVVQGRGFSQSPFSDQPRRIQWLTHSLLRPAARRRSRFRGSPAPPASGRSPSRFLVVTAFSTAPSSLYGRYEHREHLSSLTITFVYAVYALGVVASLVLFGHVGLVWPTRGAASRDRHHDRGGGAVPRPEITRRSVRRAGAHGLRRRRRGPTATAFITDLDGGTGGGPTRRAGIVGTIANIGGPASGPLIAGLLAR
jgi:hypothetical protein